MMQLELTQPQHFNGEDLFLLEGELTDVQCAQTTVNLLEQVERHVKAKSLTSGVAAIVGGMPGMLANSAMLAMYDGEDTFNYAGIVGDQVICGTHRGANTFKEGDKIKAVVSKRGEVLFVHALMRERDKMLFMPLTTVAGMRAHFRSCMRVAMWMTIWLWLFLLGTLFFIELASEKKLSSEELQFVVVAVLTLAPAMSYPFELWTYNTTKSLGEHASAIFRVFGFPRPDDLTVLKAIHLGLPGGPPGADGAFNYERALELHARR